MSLGSMVTPPMSMSSHSFIANAQQLDSGLRFVDESLLSHAILGSLHIRTYTVHSTVLKFNERFSIYTQDRNKDGWVQEKCGRSTS